MKILAIETSCDETAAAVTQGRRVWSNIVFSQIDIHKEYGGVYPILAKREHQKKIEPVVAKALRIAQTKIGNVDAIAVTFGPGLVVALEIGLNYAKQLASEYQKPLIPVDHIEGHIYSSFCQNRNGVPALKPNFPFLALIVSGGTTSLILVKNHLDYQILGQTLDDAAGEALDKAAKIIGLGYPGGPIIEKLAQDGNPKSYPLPIPMIGSNDLNFSYSGLKTAFKYTVEKMNQNEINQNLKNLSASFQTTLIKSIIQKLDRAIAQTKVKTIVLGGGVMANKKLRQEIRKTAKKYQVSAIFPKEKKLFNDNAAMIGVAGYYKYQEGIFLKKNYDKLERIARPNLKLWTKSGK